MKSLQILALSLLLASLALAPADAMHNSFGGPRQDGGTTEDKLARMALILDLTAEQQKQIAAVVADNRVEMARLRNQAATHREEVRKLSEAEVLDESLLREALRGQAEIRAELMIARHALRSQIGQILTPAQQQKHLQLREQRTAKWGKRQHGGP